MNVTWAIARRELWGLFSTPLAWVLLAVTQGLSAWLFLVLVEDFQRLEPRLSPLENAPGVTDLVVAPLLQGAAWLLLVTAPLLTMTAIGGERRDGTLVLLTTAPLSPATVVTGKYLGALGFVLLLATPAGAMSLALLMGAPIALGRLATGWGGLVLLGAAAAAVGLWTSTLFAQPAAAAGAALGILVFTVFAEGAATPEESRALLVYLSPLGHFRPLLQGLVTAADLGYFLGVIAGFWGLSALRLAGEGLR
ncbi:MAG: ABC transporter permease [Candidatus Competibacterales bacterium]